MLSNLSLVYISVTLYTVIKASVVVWVFFWGVLFRLEKFKILTFLAVLITSAGLGMAVSSHTVIRVDGIFLCLGAAAAGGLRWALTQQLMVSDESSKNVFVAIYRFAPASALSMLPFALFIEVGPLLRSRFLNQRQALLEAFSMTFVGGLIAFILILTEVNLVRISSSLTMGTYNCTLRVQSHTRSIISYTLPVDRGTLSIIAVTHLNYNFLVTISPPRAPAPSLFSKYILSSWHASISRCSLSR